MKLKDALPPNICKPHRCPQCHLVFRAVRCSRSNQVKDFTYYFCEDCGAVTYTGRVMAEGKRMQIKRKRSLRRYWGSV